MSYWARITLVPLLVLMQLKPLARNPERVTLDELFVEPPFSVRRWPKGSNQRGFWGGVFGALASSKREDERPGWVVDLDQYQKILPVDVV